MSTLDEYLKRATPQERADLQQKGKGLAERGVAPDQSPYRSTTVPDHSKITNEEKTLDKKTESNLQKVTDAPEQNQRGADKIRQAMPDPAKKESIEPANTLVKKNEVNMTKEPEKER